MVIAQNYQKPSLQALDDQTSRMVVVESYLLFFVLFYIFYLLFERGSTGCVAENINHT